jgi:hypothetical protein
MKINIFLLLLTILVNNDNIYSKQFPFFREGTTFPGLHVGYLNSLKLGINVCSYGPRENDYPWVVSIKANHHLMKNKVNSQSLEFNFHVPRILAGCGIMLRHYDGKSFTISPQLRVHAGINFFGQVNVPIIRHPRYHIPFAELGIEINLNPCSIVALLKNFH